MGLFGFNPLSLPAHNPPKDKNSWPPGSELRTKFGQQGLWWPKKLGGAHLSGEEIEPYRQLGDDPVDQILRLLEAENKTLGPTDDLLRMADEAQSIDFSQRTPAEKAMTSFIEKCSKLPDWVDQEQLRRGQEVFLTYTPVASLALYYRSLIAGFSIPKIAAVIRATAYLSPPSRPDQALQRLLDTGELTAACIGLGLDPIMPGGLGWKTALYVRVLHAKVRYALLRRKGDRKWDSDTLGLPINQEDMAATLLAFSVNVLDGIDIIAGIPVREQERLDYLALWRYLGWLLGVESEGDSRSEGLPTCEELPPLDPCGPGPGQLNNASKRSAALLDSFILHLLHPDDSSAVVAHHLLKITDRKPPSLKLSEVPDEFYKNELFYYRSLQCRRLIGDPLADALQLPFHPVRWKRIKLWMKSTFILSLLRCYTLASMWIPFVRKRVIEWHTSAFQKFHEHWIETHQSKMAKALAKNEKASCIKEDDDKNKEEDPALMEKSNDGSDASQSLCPFAMIAPPQ